MKNDKEVGRHVFCFNKKDNGGEALTLTTKFIADEKRPSKVFINQEITLASIGSSATFNLSGITISPHDLRKLADELDKVFLNPPTPKPIKPPTPEIFIKTAPIAFIRPDDREVFSINDDGTYSLDLIKKSYAASFCCRYTEGTMFRSGFEPVY